jgi:hypothetical protein
MDVFATAKRQYRLQLRPDEVLAEAGWPDGRPRIEEVNAALGQLVTWGNLESYPDTARVDPRDWRARQVGGMTRDAPRPDGFAPSLPCLLIMAVQGATPWWGSRGQSPLA